MIYADPWDEALRLESLMEAELLMGSKRSASRISDEAFAGIESPRPEPTALRRLESTTSLRSTLGVLYSGHPDGVSSN
jgi:hypothetical protein